MVKANKASQGRSQCLGVETQDRRMFNKIPLKILSPIFGTASKDSTAKLYDTETLECLKTYKTERPVNSASISPKFDHVSHS